MTIFYDSRYAEDGSVRFTAYDARDGKYKKTVFRQWPSYSSAFTYHTWVETDRIDLVALEYMGRADLWWNLMDINPELLDPFNVPVGTRIRIPRD